MGLFEDFSRFLETRLDEFLQANPHLELLALEDQLRGQEEDAISLLGDLKRREKQLEESILSTAQEIKRWHGRIEKARAANRIDLLQAAQEREATLLRQGNHLWGQMKGVKERVQHTRDLQQKIHTKRKELKIKIAQAEASRAANSSEANYKSAAQWGKKDWAQSSYSSFNRPLDPLEETFQQWETEEELEDLKRQMNR